jgi:hypothetical protein
VDAEESLDGMKVFALYLVVDGVETEGRFHLLLHRSPLFTDLGLTRSQAAAGVIRNGFLLQLI